MSELVSVNGSQPDVALNGHNVIGRSRNCNLHLDDPRVSALHAQLQWTASGWELRDLGSRNGTWVNGQRLPPGKTVLLTKGAVLAFGSNAQCWRLVNTNQPRAFALPLDGGNNVYAKGEILALPSPTNPLLSVFRRPDDSWVAEDAVAAKQVTDGDTVAVDGTTWRLSLPTPNQGTVDDDSMTPGLSRIGVELAHSQDEEHISVTLLLSNRNVTLRPRAHNYLLLTLARARQTDAENPKLPESEHGWVFVQELTKMLGCGENNINVDVYRARRQFEDAGVGGAAQLIERRPDSRQIRLGIGRLHIRPV